MNDQEKEQLSLADIHVFNDMYQIKNEQGQVLDFKDHPFLWDIYSDMAPFQAIRKAAQVGFSTTAIIKSLWLAKAKKMDMIYTLPTYGDVHDFVSSKVNRIIDQNPILKKWTEDKDTIEQKRVGESVIYYRGTWSERAALMITSDLNVHDEVDRSNLAVVDQYYSRLQHSKYAWQWLFSNPSGPGVGVDKLWNKSDQKHWFVPCPKCGKQQYLTMLNVMEKEGGEYYFGCTKCQTELNRRKGKWVKRWAEITDISGYWISLLMCPWVTANKIKELERTKSAEYFDNFVLGIPHIGSGNTVMKDVIIRNLTDEINKQEGRIVIGVDPGVDIRYVIGNREGLFYYGQCKDYDELDNLMKRWDKAVMVMDQGGDIIGSRKLRDKYRNRVFLASYRQDRKNDELFRWNDPDGSVQIDRNNSIQLVIDEFKDKRIPIYGTETDWYDYWVHWSHIYRTVEEDSFGRPRYKWQRSDRDDWVHATVYWRCGIDRFMNTQGEIIDITSSFGERGYTATPDGKHFINQRQSYS
jgi:hypothetical protein